jgi:RimJ/RimL family protein N-acetyltransferase/catechol 2,3-dioxygenase-like lactoylglutathione lyase family enzyme
MMSMADMDGIVRRQAVPCKPPEVVMAASEVLGLDHVDLTVNDLEASVAFYTAALGRLGFRRAPHASYVAFANRHLAIGLRAAGDASRGVGFARTRVGLHHLALRAPDRTAVDDFHRFLVAAGITVLDPPAEYPQYGAGYYAVFFADPDGMKLELVHWPWGYWKAAQSSGADARPRQPLRLETERLALRPFAETDLDAYAAICADPEVMRFMGSGGKPMSRAAVWRAVASYVGHWQLRGFGFWALEEKATGRLVGRAGLWRPEGWPGTEVGWLLARPAWGRGLATEAGRAALAHAFEVLGADHVVSVIHPENARSIRVAERLGERYERSTAVEAGDGGTVPVAVYGIARDAWRAASGTSL